MWAGVAMEERRTALEKARRVAELLGRSDFSGAVEFVERGRYNLLNREGCARSDPLHRRDLTVCLMCGNFDRLNFACKVERTQR